MPQISTLSQSALGVLRLLAKGCRLTVNERTRQDYRELTAAGILESVSKDCFQFTEVGWERRFELAGINTPEPSVAGSA